MSYVGGNAVVHCACRDVTDHRRARDELVYVNPRLAGMFGYAKESESSRFPSTALFQAIRDDRRWWD